VLEDAQGRGYVLDLFAHLFADAFLVPAALGAYLLLGGHIMHDAFARQVLGQGLAPVAFLHHRGGGRRFLLGRGFGLAGLRHGEFLTKQNQLRRVDAFGPWTVQPPQQLFDPLFKLHPQPTLFVKRSGEFLDQRMALGHVIRQVLGYVRGLHGA
jgi:hypothetical protein